MCEVCWIWTSSSTWHMCWVPSIHIVDPFHAHNCRLSTSVLFRKTARYLCASCKGMRTYLVLESDRFVEIKISFFYTVYKLVMLTWRHSSRDKKHGSSEETILFAWELRRLKKSISLPVQLAAKNPQAYPENESLQHTLRRFKCIVSCNYSFTTQKMFAPRFKKHHRLLHELS